MKNEAYIVQQIIAIEAPHFGDDEEDCYDAEDQTSLSILYAILDRELTLEEEEILAKERNEQEFDEDNFDEAMAIREEFINEQDKEEAQNETFY